MAPPLRDGVLIEAQTGGAEPAGALLRQPRVRDAKGREFLLDELIGPGFAVVAREQSELRLGPAAHAVLSRLDGRVVSLEGLEVTEGEADRLFEHHPAVVLRPDRYVFGVVDESWSLDRLLVELGRKLALQ